MNSFIKLLTFSCATLFAFFSFGQNQENFWIFGKINSNNDTPNVLNFETLSGGLPTNDFSQTSQTNNGGNPIPNVNNVQLQVEGCAVATDPLSGDLMFYTDGESVYDAQHNLLTTNLGGHWSGSQSTAICNFPGVQDDFYIFSNPTGQGSTGAVSYRTYSYSNSTFSQDQYLPGTVTEGMLIIPCITNPNIYWLVTHLANSNTFRVFLVDGTGQFNYQDYNFGPYFYGNTLSNFAYSGASQTFGFVNQIVDGSTWYPDEVYTITFDQSSGNFDLSTLTLRNTVNTAPGSIKPVNVYDLEFSPNGQILYYTVNRYIFYAAPHPWALNLYETECGFYHHDLNTNVATLIDNFSFQGMETNGRMFGLKLGPDNKIYTITEAIHTPQSITPEKTTIGAINDPNNDWNLINFDPAIYQNYGVMAYKFPEFIMTSDRKNSVASLNDMDPEQQEAKVYPNPAKERITIELSDNAISNASIKILSMDGKVVRDLGQINNFSKVDVDISDLPKGTYMIYIESLAYQIKTLFVKE